jgi:DNA helicase II / ATP-dependent DNA helicase PcrA
MAKSSDGSRNAWTCVGIVDRRQASHTCENCGRESVRYVHLLTHLKKGTLAVGCVCAARMVRGYDAKGEEAKLRNRLKRKQIFRDKGWRRSSSGNLTRTKGHIYITVGQGSWGGFWASVGKKFVPGYFATIEAAKDAAFDEYDRDGV